MAGRMGDYTFWNESRDLDNPNEMNNNDMTFFDQNAANNVSTLEGLVRQTVNCEPEPRPPPARSGKNISMHDTHPRTPRPTPEEIQQNSATKRKKYNDSFFDSGTPKRQRLSSLNDSIDFDLILRHKRREFDRHEAEFNTQRSQLKALLEIIVRRDVPGAVKLASLTSLGDILNEKCPVNVAESVFAEQPDIIQILDEIVQRQTDSEMAVANILIVLSSKCLRLMLSTGYDQHLSNMLKRMKRSGISDVVSKTRIIVSLLTNNQ